MVDASGDGFETCVRRAKEMEEKGLRYMTMCMLGSVRDALKGCGFLVSGDRSAYDELEVVLKKAAREDEYESAVAYMGPSVSASYLDTVLGGMVTAEETSLSEAYAMLVAAGFTNEEVGKSMGGWNKEELEGPLVEEAVTVLRKRDEEEGDAYVVDKVVDSARMLGDAGALMREMNERHKNVATVAEAVSEALLARESEVRAKRRNGGRVGGSERDGRASELRLAEAGSRTAGGRSPERGDLCDDDDVHPRIPAASGGERRLRVVCVVRGGGASDRDEFGGTLWRSDAVGERRKCEV